MFRVNWNKPVGDNARKGAVRKRTQLRSKTMGEGTRTKRDKNTGKLIDQKNPAATKKLKGARLEKKAG